MASLMHRDYPRAIIHVDGDSFFASCEIALNPSLKGKPVVTGHERGIASAMSYEAKMKGVTTGMSIREARRLCPDMVLIRSDYESYGIFSKRMYDIVRRYTPDVDEYSIDECFADITGLQRPMHMSYEQIAEKMRRELETELGITFSMGLAPTKVLAKVGSKFKKPEPSGFTPIPGRKIHLYLQKIPIGKIWGIGKNTTEYLQKFGIKTAFDFAIKPEYWVIQNLSKPGQELWNELNGKMIFALNTQKKESYKSISKTRSFSPPSTDKQFVFSQLSKNIENACIKARRYTLLPKRLSFFVKTQEFQYFSCEIKLAYPCANPNILMEFVEDNFSNVFKKGVKYRATGVRLCDFVQKSDAIQPDLFGLTQKSNNTARIFESVDAIASKYGKHTIFLGTSFSAMVTPQHTGTRSAPTRRNKQRFKTETLRKHIGIPMMGEVI